MQLVIKDVLKVKSADITVQPGEITLLAGLNKAGKTSIMWAAQALMTNNRRPDGGTLVTSETWVRDGADCGIATLLSNVGNLRIMWRKGEATSEGEGPKVIGDSAAGLKGLLDLNKEERAKVLIPLLGAAPTEKEFEKALTDAGANAIEVAEYWLKASKLSYSAALKTAEEDGKLLKRRWQECTGKPRYGRMEAASWRPDGWDFALETKALEDLNSAVQLAEAERVNAVKAAAISDHDRERIKALIAEVPKHEKELEELDGQISRDDGSLAVARALLQSLPPVDKAEPTKQCPHSECKREIAVRNGDLFIPDGKKLDPSEAKIREARIAETQQKIKDLNARMADNKARHAELRTIVKNIAAEQQKLNMATTNAAKSTKTLEQATADYQSAEKALKMVITRNSAQELHKQIAVNDKIQEILSPNGLQSSKLGAGLKKFQEQILDPLCAASGCPKIEFLNDMTILSDGFDCDIIGPSGGELWNVSAVLRVALAMLQKIDIALFDEASILDRTSRAGLIQMLKKSKLGAIVCMMANAPEDVPNLAKWGMGRTYWVEDGIATEVKQPVAAG